MKNKLLLAALTTGPLLGAVFLVAGTSIGAGMLATPIITAQYGFGAAVGLFAVCWVMMTLAALLMLEVNLWFPSGDNIVSMAQGSLGKVGAVVAWLSYLFLLYALMVAYISGVSDLLVTGVSALLHVHLPLWAGAGILVGLLLMVTLIGTRATDYFNRLLMFGLVSCYFALVFVLAPHVDTARLVSLKWHGIWNTLPVIATTFGYQIVIPSLRAYLPGRVSRVRWGIIVGSLIPLLVYIIWELLIVGVLPLSGSHGLLQLQSSGQTVNALIGALNTVSRSSVTAFMPEAFIFFAISTSFVGVSLSLFDFLADGLPTRIHALPFRGGDLSVAALTFVPPMIFALYFPHVFINALAYGGVFVAVLLVMLPAVMAWSGRYIKGLSKVGESYRVMGGRPLLLLVMLFALGIIWVEGWRLS